jgi:ABC-type xylose transport system permease subunit
MSVIISSINLLGIDMNWVEFVLGGALLLAVMADVLSKRQSARTLRVAASGRGAART